MILEVTTAPTLRPLSVSEASQFLRLDASDENTLLEALIDAARQKCELLTERTLLTTTYAMKLDAFPASRRIALARAMALVSSMRLDASAVGPSAAAWTAARCAASARLWRRMSTDGAGLMFEILARPSRRRLRLLCLRNRLASSESLTR